VKGSSRCRLLVPPAVACITLRLWADIKRRETSSYLIATSGNKGVTLWALEPMSGSLAPTRVRVLYSCRPVLPTLTWLWLFRAFVPYQVTTGVGFSRDVSSLTFSSDREWLYGGTSSGDFVCINVRPRAPPLR
jgi:cilia- and flagella-associated protein 52